MRAPRVQNAFSESTVLLFSPVSQWSFLAQHLRVLVCIAHDPGVRLRDIAATLEIIDCSAHGIVNDFAIAGYVVKERGGRRSRYQIQNHLPLKNIVSQELNIGKVLDLLVHTTTIDPQEAVLL
jgi:hypothetical protein